MKNTRLGKTFVTAFAFLLSVPAAMAHHLPPGLDEVDEFAENAFMSALKHPITGLDHWLAALAIGFIACSLGRKQGVQSLVAFIVCMACGVFLGHAGMTVPFLEQGLAASVILAGAALVGASFLSREGLGMTAGLVGFWHGLAHGSEMPTVFNPVSYGFGLCFGSALIAFSAWIPDGTMPTKNVLLGRIAGGSLAAAGTGMLIASFV